MYLIFCQNINSCLNYIFRLKTFKMADKPQRSQKIPLKYREYEMDPNEVKTPERNLPHPGPSPDFPPIGK